MTMDFTTAISIASSDVDTCTWHYQFGHMSDKGMKAMLSKGELPGLKYIDLDFCKVCVYEKQRNVSFSEIKKSSKTKGLELVHTDGYGTVYVPSLGGSLYFVIFIVDASRKV